MEEAREEDMADDEVSLSASDEDPQHPNGDAAGMRVTALRPLLSLAALAQIKLAHFAVLDQCPCMDAARMSAHASNANVALSSCFSITSLGHYQASRTFSLKSCIAGLSMCSCLATAGRRGRHVIARDGV